MGLVLKRKQSSRICSIGGSSTNNEPVVEPEVQFPANQSPEVEPPQAFAARRPQSERQLPAYLEDFELDTRRTTSDEEIVNFALYADCDLSLLMKLGVINIG